MELSNPEPKFPEEIFPLEVWSLILENVGSAIDLENCSKTCRAWQKLLLSKRTTYLMPKVFPILYEYLRNDNKDKKDETDEDSDETDEDSDDESEVDDSKEDPLPVILKIRLISTSWKESVDSYYQNHSAFNDINFVGKLQEVRMSELKQNEPYTLLPYHFDRKNVSELESFLANDFPPESNPFITRYVNYDNRIHSGKKRLKRRLQTNFKRLLESYGGHIWNCVLKFSWYTSVVELYQLIRSYLSLMPNLRSLDIFFSHEKQMFAGEEMNGYTEFQGLLKENPFPKLEHITKLHLYKAPYLISVGFLAQNKQLRSLSIVRVFSRSYILDPVMEVEDLKLEQLVVFSDFDKDWNQQLQRLNWPLKALHLSLSGWIRCANIFQALSTFKDSLHHLILSIAWIEEETSGLKKLRLELPNLTKFKLKTFGNLKTIDFLTECTALQEVELDIKIEKSNEEQKHDDTMEDDENEEVIQFASCVKSMLKSNVWSILPNLLILKIDTNEYKTPLNTKFKFTRRQYEKYAKNLKKRSSRRMRQGTRRSLRRIECK